MKSGVKEASWGQEGADRTSCWGGGCWLATGQLGLPLSGVSSWLTMLPSTPPQRQAWLSPLEFSAQADTPTPSEVTRFLVRPHSFSSPEGEQEGHAMGIREAESPPNGGPFRVAIALEPRWENPLSLSLACCIATPILLSSCEALQLVPCAPLLNPSVHCFPGVLHSCWVGRRQALPLGWPPWGGVFLGPHP